MQWQLRGRDVAMGGGTGADYICEWFGFPASTVLTERNLDPLSLWIFICFFSFSLRFVRCRLARF